MQHVQIVNIIRFKNTISIVLMNMFLKIQRFFKEPVTFSLEFHVIIFLELPGSAIKRIACIPWSECVLDISIKPACEVVNTKIPHP